jgi:hypothetical protein
LTHVSRSHQRFAARGGAQNAKSLVEVRALSPGEDDMRSSPRYRARKVTAKAAACADDDRNPATEHLAP